MERFEALIGVNPWTALFVLLNTLTVFFVAKKYLFGPVMKLIEERQQEIDRLYEAAGSAKDEADALKKEYQDRLAAAQTSSERMMKEAVARARSREETLLRQARAEAAAIRDRADADIAREKKKALSEARDELAGLVMAIAGKVVGRTLNEQDQGALVDRFIRELGEQP